MKLIVGLGNYGNEYKNTRHNIGFRFIDSYFLNQNIIWKNKFKGLYCEKTINGEKIIFLKPQTYMNLSGESVILFAKYYKIKPEEILIISDDLALPIGTYRLRSQGSSGGHNGLKNIASCLGTEKFKRLKVGISKNNSIDIKDYVLGKISKEELDTLNDLFKELNLIIDDFFVLPFSDLMSKYNRKNR